MDQTRPARLVASSTATPASAAAIGEIVEVTTTGFVAQCLETPRGSTPRLFDPPDFGALIKIGALGPVMPIETGETEEADPFAAPAPQAPLRLEPAMSFAVVSYARMTSLDAGRRPTALGYADEDELRLEQPQIFELITTEFSGVLIAHTDSDGTLRRHLPPRPPRIHARVASCTPAETIAVTEDLNFLARILHGVAGSEAPAADLCAAIIRQAWHARGRSTAYLHGAGGQLGPMLGADYDLLQRILRSVVS